MKRAFLIVFICGFTQLSFAQLTAAKDVNAIKELFFAGLKEKLNENYVNAGISFAKIVTLDPNNDAAYFELANVSLAQNKLPEAERAIASALALKPNQVWYLKLQGEVYKRNGNMDGLVQTLDQLIKNDSETDSYYFDRGNALYIAGKLEESKKAYDLLESKFGVTKASAAAKQRFNVGETSSQSLNELLAGNNDVKAYLDLSGGLLDKKQYEQALSVLLKAKEFATNHFEVNLALADVYNLQKKPELALTELKIAFANAQMPLVDKIKILNQMLAKGSKPGIAKNVADLGKIALNQYRDDPKVLVVYGDILYNQGNLSAAKEQYAAAVQKGEQNYIAWEKLLGVQTLMGNFAEAIKTSDDALAMYPNQAILYYYRAFSLHRNAQNAEAALEIKNALQLNPDDTNLKAMILALQAEVFIDQSKFKEADEAFDKAVNLAPNNYLTISNYAYYLALRNHNLAKAESLASTAAVGLPQNASVLDTYAVVLFKLNKFDEALKAIESALKNNEGDNPVYLEHYGDILFSKGKKEEAVLQWEKAKTAGNQSEKLNRKINEKKYIK